MKRRRVTLRVAAMDALAVISVIGAAFIVCLGVLEANDGMTAGLFKVPIGLLLMLPGYGWLIKS